MFDAGGSFFGDEGPAMLEPTFYSSVDDTEQQERRGEKESFFGERRRRTNMTNGRKRGAKKRGRTTRRKREGAGSQDASATAVSPVWLPMTNLNYVSFYGSPSPALNACSYPQWVCYGDYVLLKLPNYSDNDYWYGPWWTVHSCNFVGQLNLFGAGAGTTNLTRFSAWNSYGVFLTPYYYSSSDNGYDHLRTSMGIFQIIPYGTSTSTCSPGTSPMCSSNPLYGQPVCSGDTIYLQWNMLCTHNNPTYCEVPYCWGNISGNTARLAWFSDSDHFPGVTWPLYISQNYQYDSSSNTSSGNSCIVYDMPQIVDNTSVSSPNPNNQVYMNNSSWTNDKYTLFVVQGSSSGKNISYGDSVTFDAYDESGYHIVVDNFKAGNNTSQNEYSKSMPLQFSQQLRIGTDTAAAFQVMPATNPLVTTSPVQQLMCFDSPGQCNAQKPPCTTGSPGCVNKQWECIDSIYQGCNCPLSKCDANGLCLSPPGAQPVKTVTDGKCNFTCNKGINPYLYFLLPALIVVIFLFMFFVI